jgi:hypothetical protein
MADSTRRLRRAERGLIALLAQLGFASAGTGGEPPWSAEPAKLILRFEEDGDSRQAPPPQATPGEPPANPPRPGEPGERPPSPSEPAGGAPSGREAAEKPAPLRGVYDKPFLGNLGRRAYLGGYTEFEYHAFQDEVLGIPRGFRAHRTNLFAYADVADNVRFGSEIEFENEEPGEDLEVKVEMAFVDWILFEELTFRGGALLAPLGRVNLNHDGPVREITDRPLVSTFVIPTTLTEPGVGIHGTFRPLREMALSYEAYGTNGFRILDRNGELAAPVTEQESLLREGRPSLGGDINNDLASTGRVSVEAFSSVVVGGSWHVGTYDERSDNLLTIFAGDLAIVKGPFALEGEIAQADFERDAFARTAGVPDRFWGYYVQASVSHLPRFLKRAAPNLFDREGAKFTLVVRYDWIDLDGDRAEAIEPGLNFRPFSDTVFKFSYRFGLESLGIRNVPGREGFDDDGFVFSLASYF